MDKKELILTVAKDLCVAFHVKGTTTKDEEKKFLDLVNIVGSAYSSIKG